MNPEQQNKLKKKRGVHPLTKDISKQPNQTVANSLKPEIDIGPTSSQSTANVEFVPQVVTETKQSSTLAAERINQIPSKGDTSKRNKAITRTILGKA